MAAKQPDGGRRTFSGNDPNVTYVADENAILVPSRHSGGHDAGSSSKSTGRPSIRHRPSTSQFSQQLQAASYNIKHFDQFQADLYQTQAAIPAKTIDGKSHLARLPHSPPLISPLDGQLHPTVYVPPLKTGKNEEGKIENSVVLDGSSPQSSASCDAYNRTRPSPLQIKRSLSNVKSAFKNRSTSSTLLNKLGFSAHNNQSVADNASPLLGAKQSVPENTASKAARTLGETPTTASTATKTPSTAHTFASATSSRNQTHLVSASTGTPDTRHSGDSKPHLTSWSFGPERLDMLNRTLAQGDVSQSSLFTTHDLSTPDNERPPAAFPHNSGSKGQQRAEQQQQQRPSSPTPSLLVTTPLRTDASSVESKHDAADVKMSGTNPENYNTRLSILDISQHSSRDVSGASRMTVPIRYDRNTYGETTLPHAIPSGPRPWYPNEAVDALMQLQDFESSYSETRAAFISQSDDRLLAMQGGLQVLFNIMTQFTEPDYREIIDELIVAIKTAISNAAEEGSMNNRTATPHVMHGYTQNLYHFHPQSTESRRNAGHTDHGDHGRLRGRANAGESIANQNRFSQESTQTQPEMFTITGVNTPARQSPERYDRGRPDYVNGADIAQGMLLRNNIEGAIRPNYFERLGRPSQHDQRTYPENSRTSQPSLPANYPQLPQGPPVAPRESHWQSQQGQQGLNGQQGPQAAYMPGMGVAYRDENRERELWHRRIQPTTEAHQERLRQEEQMNREWLMTNMYNEVGRTAPDSQARDIVGQVPRPPHTYVPGQGPHLRDIHPAHRP